MNNKSPVHRNRPQPQLPAILLREGWREGSKTHKRTLANRSYWPKARIETLRRLFCYSKMRSGSDVIRFGPRSLPPRLRKRSALTKPRKVFRCTASRLCSRSWPAAPGWPTNFNREVRGCLSDRCRSPRRSRRERPKGPLLAASTLSSGQAVCAGRDGWEAVPAAMFTGDLGRSVRKRIWGTTERVELAGSV